jgi:hypothetical protein
MRTESEQNTIHIAERRPMPSASPLSEIVTSDRRRFLRIAGALASSSALDLVGCGGGTTTPKGPAGDFTDGGKTTHSAVGGLMHLVLEAGMVYWKYPYNQCINFRSMPP